MKAVALFKYLPIADPESLVDVELPDPTPGGRDLLVAVRAVSVNPIDVKVRAPKPTVEAQARVLGWDAAGVVVEVGPEVRLFRAGDEVFYAGSILRPGSNAELQLVDERIVGHKPTRLGFAEAAALPLTGLTAWELLFERLGVPRGEPKQPAGTLVIIGAGGGVGSMAVQLARRLTGLTVVATAARPETAEWARQLGAHHVIDHGKPLPPQLVPLAPEGAGYVLGLTHSGEHYPAIVEMLAPQGKLGIIDDPGRPIDVTLLKKKSASLCWESMFTRSTFDTPDLVVQHRILDELARLVDNQVLRTTMTADLGAINAANLKRAHALIESGSARGKTVLSNF
jgi:zinc-binding alcohol dehydrogenase family protein